MRDPRSAKLSAALYRGAISLGGVFILVGFCSLAQPSVAWPSVLLLATLAFVAERYPLELPGYGVVSGLESAVLAALFMGQYAGAVVVLAAGVLSRSLRRGSESRLDFTVYTFFQLGLCFALPFSLALLAPAGWHLPALVLAALMVGVLDQVCAACHLYLLQNRIGRPGTRVEWSRIRLTATLFVPVGLLLSAALQLGSVVTGLLLLPLAVAFRGIRSYIATLQEAREVVASLVEAAERREVGSTGHAERVAQWAGDIARELGLREQHVRRIVNAGRLHDLGKIGIDESILNKCGKLSEADFASLRRHPEVGANVAAHLSLGKQEAEYIRYHHERFDGRGYPCGLVGQSIPQGARILAVAEAYDSMLHNGHRPKKLSPVQAIAELEAGQGTQFDPSVVKAFRSVLQKKSA